MFWAIEKAMAVKRQLPSGKLELFPSQIVLQYLPTDFCLVCHFQTLMFHVSLLSKHILIFRYERKDHQHEARCRYYLSVL
jgi:hypothetical protein